MNPDQATLDEIARRLSGHRAEEWNVTKYLAFASGKEQAMCWLCTNSNGQPSVVFHSAHEAARFLKTGEMPDER